MAAIRTKVRMSLGAFFGVTGSVMTAVDEDDKDTSFKIVCCGDGTTIEDGPDKGKVNQHAPAGIRQSMKCPVCSSEAKATFKRASESGGTYTVLSAETLAEAAATDDDKLKLSLAVHEADSFGTETLPGGKVYFFSPNKGDESTYALFREMIAQSPDLVFVARWAARTKVALYRIGVYGTALTMTQIAWPSAVREAPEVDADFQASDLKTALLIAKTAVVPYDAADYKDKRKETLLDAIAKAEGIEGAVVPEGDTPTATPAASSTTTMLQAQLAAMMAAKEADAAAKPAPRKRAPRKKVAA